MIKNSYIYTGSVIHKRFKTTIHSFKYKVFSLLIDLAELDTLQKNLKIFSYNKFNIVSFFDVDHGPRDGSSVENWVKDNLKKIIKSMKTYKLNFYVIQEYLVMFLIH